MNPTLSSPRHAIKPPDKGSFPLDHDGECKEFMTKYMDCLKNNSKVTENCREESKAYLNCRMEKNLMKKEPWKLLGYKDSDDQTKGNKLS